MPKLALLPLALSLVTLALLAPTEALAKRSPPVKVAPLKAGEIEYRVNHDQMGCVEAWDVAHQEMLWRRQIYVVRFLPDLERDVQDIYIRSIELRDGHLIVKNERGSEYQLSLDSLAVKVVKGALVEATRVEGK